MTREKAKAIVNFIRVHGTFGINPNFNLDALKDWAEGKELERRCLDKWEPVDEEDNLCGANYRVVYNDGGIRPYTALEFSQIAFSDSRPLIRRKSDRYEVLRVGRESVTLNVPGTLVQISLTYEELLRECLWVSNDFCGVVIWPKELMGSSWSEEEFLENMNKRREFLDSLSMKHSLGEL